MENKQVDTSELETVRKKTVDHLRSMLEGHSNVALSTEELAAACKVKAGSIRRALCVNGHFLGLIPRKFSNGRLFWQL